MTMHPIGVWASVAGLGLALIACKSGAPSDEKPSCESVGGICTENGPGPGCPAGYGEYADVNFATCPQIGPYTVYCCYPDKRASCDFHPCSPGGFACYGGAWVYDDGGACISPSARNDDDSGTLCGDITCIPPCSCGDPGTSHCSCL
jgi:hypothetical protein